MGSFVVEVKKQVYKFMSDFIRTKKVEAYSKLISHDTCEFPSNSNHQLDHKSWEKEKYINT